MSPRILSFLFVLFFIFTTWTAQLISDFSISEKANLKKALKFFSSNEQISDIVISLTTMPRRLRSKSFKKVIEQILLQTVRAQEIRINIPYVLKKTDEKYVIPGWLKKLPVTIVRCEDWGPATKYIPTLQHFSTNLHQNILVYDDDVLMPLNTIKLYVKYLSKFPNKVLTCKGNVLKRKKNRPWRRSRVCTKYEEGYMYLCGLHPVLKFIFDYVLCDQPRYLGRKDKQKKVDIIFGGAGYCLQPWMLNLKDLSDYKNMPKEAFFVDDIVISGNLAKNKVDRIIIPELQLPKVTSETALNYVSGYLKFPDIESLWTNSNSDSHNNDVMVKYFSKFW